MGGSLEWLLGANQAVTPSDLGSEEAALVRAAARRILRSIQVQEDSQEARREGVVLKQISTGAEGGVTADDWNPGLGIGVDGGATHTEVTLPLTCSDPEVCRGRSQKVALPKGPGYRAQPGKQRLRGGTC